MNRQPTRNVPLVEGYGAVASIAAGDATDGRAVGRIFVGTREEHGVSEVAF
jgi:hypothetical protein